VFIALLVCSESGCPETLEAHAPTLAELESLACECGCALQVLGWPDWEPQPPARLRLAPPAQHLPIAA